jgi:predicted RecB family nuclease
MPVTASILYDLVHCPQRVALDAFGDPARRDEINPFVKLLWERGALYERETIGALRVPFLDLSGLDGEERERQTLDAMSRGEPLIYAGRICAEDLLGVPDLLRKEGAGYVPGDIKSGAGEEGGGDDSDGKPKLHYAVQLALYIDILERTGFSAGRRAFVWDIHGDEVPYDFTCAQSPRRSETLWDEYQSTLAEARSILARGLIPQAAYGSVCKLCHWHTFCIDELGIADDLTLIPFLGRNLRDAMQGTISTIGELAASNPDGFINGKKTVFPGLGPDRLKVFHARAVMLKDAAPKPFLRAPIMLRAVPVELFFDVEVDPMRDICYLHGILERRNGDINTERFIHFFVEDASAQAERDAFAGAVTYLIGEAEGAIYYYSKYERTIYRKLQAKYPDVCSRDDIERLFDPARATDLYGDIVLKSTEWPTRDHSIKTLAAYLGFKWRDAHPSGAASIEWFDRWCKERAAAIKERILDYNEDDCRATRVLLDGIRAISI